MKEPRRVVIDRIFPHVPQEATESRVFPIKRIVGEEVVVRAVLLCDSHDLLQGVVRYRSLPRGRWREVPLTDAGNDEWVGTFTPDRAGLWEYTVEGWIDHPGTWQRGIAKKRDAQVVEEVDLLMGAQLYRAAAQRAESAGAAKATDKKHISAAVKIMVDATVPLSTRVATALDPHLVATVATYRDEATVVRREPALPLRVDRPLAGCSAWYELFPRSTAPNTAAAAHGTFRDVIAQIPYVAQMGFDILYLPPIHPIGTVARKGRNNSVTPTANDPGSPWAIGSAQGGHTAIHQELGTLEDFFALRDACRDAGLELALDIAFQCAPDHPWVTEHPEWFLQRPDGSIQYAENPPKKYQDIYPLNFETPQWEELWDALRDVFLYWVDCGITVFRVDNPHTKAFSFWEWVIPEVQQYNQDVIFLAEAFTRPNRMYRLAKGGFTQSYTYFTWRNSAHEMREYLTELTSDGVIDFFRPNFWPNTPDILHEDLQTGGRAAFVTRFILAATLSSTYGIYGPAFELQESQPLRKGSEEYLDSEKYQIRRWNLNETWSLAPLISTVNGIRRSNPALQQNRTLRFHHCDNDNLLCYSKHTAEGNCILVCVNMDFHNPQSGWVQFSPQSCGLPAHESFTVRDLLSHVSYQWEGEWNYIALRPSDTIAHIFLLE